jgi:hypothetical protein
MDTIELQKQLDAMQMAYKEMLIFLEKKLNTIEEYKEKVKAQRQLIDDKNNLLDKKRAEIVKLHNVLGLYPKERIIK